mmetsp:Transcript_10826/g.36096  ORF Transcript_10826/g.36096 Transcript_10826/m.36096 type:complete len:206 (-) Transcript_10826:314-931(-)
MVISPGLGIVASVSVLPAAQPLAHGALRRVTAKRRERSAEHWPRTHAVGCRSSHFSSAGVDCRPRKTLRSGSRPKSWTHLRCARAAFTKGSASARSSASFSSIASAASWSAMSSECSSGTYMNARIWDGTFKSTPYKTAVRAIFAARSPASYLRASENSALGSWSRSKISPRQASSGGTPAAAPRSIASSSSSGAASPRRFFASA